MLRLFTAHPASVGETYWQHWQFASRTGLMMTGAGLACLVHGLLPFLFVTTGSRTIRKLAARVGGAQPRHARPVMRVAPLKRGNGLDGSAVAESLTSAAL